MHWKNYFFDRFIRRRIGTVIQSLFYLSAASCSVRPLSSFTGSFVLSLILSPMSSPRYFSHIFIIIRRFLCWYQKFMKFIKLYVNSYHFTYGFFWKFLQKMKAIHLKYDMPQNMPKRDRHFILCRSRKITYYLLKYRGHAVIFQ